jgi:polysaccharide pyruvyl transferase WcaK-like protein
MLNIKEVREISYEEPRELFRIFEKLDVFVGMRLHSLMLGTLSNTAMLGINYDPKVKSFCTFMGIPCVDIGNIKKNTLEEEIGNAITSKEDYTEKIQIFADRLRRSWEILKDYI